MSMIMSHLQRKPGFCPRPDCIDMGVVSKSGSSVLTWYDMLANIPTWSLTRHSASCQLSLFSSPNDLDDAFRRVIVSEDDVGRQQVEEDQRLYGIRSEPTDTVEVDESTQLANLPPKRSASEFEAAVDRPAKMRKKGKTKEFNYQALTIMDWNNGASPLDAWLNQSAVPSTTAASDHQESMKLESNLLAQEIEEMKVFRNVHMAIAPSPKSHDPPLERIEGLDFGAQIYYRNIMDRYPVIPTYLARRLAQANHDRAERLRNEKRKPKESSIDDVTQPQKDFSDIIASTNDTVDELISRNPLFAPLTPPSPTQKDAACLPRPPPFEDLMDGSYPAGYPSIRRHPTIPLAPPPVPDFWTGKSQSQGPASADSRSSSMNSSLHGRPEFDLQEQNPTFMSQYPVLAACDPQRSPALPPPPIGLGKVSTFNCDICGQDIQVKRRLEWQ